MKKIINLILVLALIFTPTIILSACVSGSVSERFVVKSTELPALDFFKNIRKQKSNFFNYLDEISVAESLIGSEKVVYNSIEDSMQGIEDRIYMVMPALDFYLNDVDDQIGLYCLDDMGLDDYTLYKKSSSNEIRKYYKNFNGNDETGYLPIVSRSSEDFVDAVDGVISTWGNALNFDVSFNVHSNTFEIKVSTTFHFPSNTILPEDDKLDTGGLKIKREESEKKIIVVYKPEESGNVYSKVITFAVEEESEGGDGEVHKKVEKYLGDFTSGDADKLDAEYEYEMQSDAKILGNYSIKFNAEKSYFYAKYSISIGNYWIFETYNLKNGLISRQSNVKQGEKIRSYDFYLLSDGLNGRLKFFENNRDIDYISDIDSLEATKYAKITEEDKNNSACRKMTFEILNEKCSTKSFGY